MGSRKTESSLSEGESHSRPIFVVTPNIMLLKAPGPFSDISLQKGGMQKKHLEVSLTLPRAECLLPNGTGKNQIQLPALAQFHIAAL